MGSTSWSRKARCVGLLGPNGAGKTTALRILVGLVRADAGTVTIAGEPVEPGLGRRGAGRGDGRDPGLLPAPLGSREPARPGGRVGLDRRSRTTARIAAALGWSTWRRSVSVRRGATRPGCASVSGIALALLADPPILILDEPVNGLDPAGIAEIRDLLIELAAGGRTILVSSHLLTEVEKTCDHVTIVDRGRIVAAGTPDSLAGGGERIELRLAADEIAAAQRALEAAGFRVTPTAGPRGVVGRGRAGRGDGQSPAARPPGPIPMS